MDSGVNTMTLKCPGCKTLFSTVIGALSEWLGGPQQQCPHCGGWNDAVHFLLTEEHHLLETAVKAAPVPGILDPVIDKAAEAVVDPIVEKVAKEVETLIPGHTTYNGSGDGAPAVPVTDTPRPDAASEVGNEG